MTDTTSTPSATELLAPLREQLDEVDRQVLALLVRRMHLCLDVAGLKAQHDIPMMQPARMGLVVRRAREHAAAHGLPPDYLGCVYEHIAAATCTQEDALIDRLCTGSEQ